MSNKVNSISEKAVTIWMRIHERLEAEKPTVAGERVSMVCANEGLQAA